VRSLRLIRRGPRKAKYRGTAGFRQMAMRSAGASPSGFGAIAQREARHANPDTVTAPVESTI